PGGADLIERIARGDFPASLYLDGPSEPLKAALLAELRAAWAASGADAPPPRVLRAAESGVEEVLAAYHGGSLFDPRDLVIVLDIEDLGRSEKKIAALAEGIARPSGASSLVLVESAADSARKSLEPLRAAAAMRWTALPPGRGDLVAWGARRLERAGIAAEPGLVEALADASEGDPLAFFSELGKLETLAAAPRGGGAPRLGRADLALLLRPAVGADLPGYLAAVALGDPGRATRSLGRLLATGVSEGTVLFALANLVGGALGGWARHRELSAALRERRSPRDLAAALDAVYRGEAAWKSGRADAVAVLEHATRVLAARAGGTRPAHASGR
ncbi:MAG TPA: hypothetical protein VI792_05985, partial [Candidatus Eisenbacteria bacterium]